MVTAFSVLYGAAVKYPAGISELSVHGILFSRKVFSWKISPVASCTYLAPSTLHFILSSLVTLCFFACVQGKGVATSQWQWLSKYCISNQSILYSQTFLDFIFTHLVGNWHGEVKYIVLLMASKYHSLLMICPPPILHTTLIIKRRGSLYLNIWLVSTICPHKCVITYSVHEHRIMLNWCAS